MKKFILFVVLTLFVSGCVTTQTTKPVITEIPAVTNLTAKGGIRMISLQWDKVENGNVLGYLIYRAPKKQGPFEQIAKIKDKFATSFVDKGGLFKHLGDNTVYFYKVAAYSKNGIGQYSNILQAQTLPAPISPTHLTAQSNLPRMVTLKWVEPKNQSIEYYNIYRSLSKKGPFKRIGKIYGHINTFFIDKGLKDETTYYYSVTSVNYKGVEGDILASVKATTKAKPYPARNISGKIAGAGKLFISWWPSVTSDVVSYKIYRGTTPKSLSLIASVPSSVLTYTDSGLNPGTTYYYKIDSLDKDNIESNSSEIKAIKTKPLPESPQGILAKQLENGSVLVQWDRGSDDVVSYKVFRRYYIVIAKVLAQTKETQYTDKQVSPNTTYYYWVKSVDKYGQESASSPTVSVKTR